MGHASEQSRGSQRHWDARRRRVIRIERPHATHAAKDDQLAAAHSSVLLPTQRGSGGSPVRGVGRDMADSALRDMSTAPDWLRHVFKELHRMNNVFQEAKADTNKFGNTMHRLRLIDVLADDTPCVAISSYEDFEIWYSCRESVPYWMSSTEEVLTGGYPIYVGLIHLSDGTPYIVSFDALAGSVSVSVRHDGTWSTEVIDTMDATGFDPHIAVDGDDRVHIGYYSLTDGTLRYAVGR